MLDSNMFNNSPHLKKNKKINEGYFTNLRMHVG